jgi:hypothetical protein
VLNFYGGADEKMSHVWKREIADYIGLALAGIYELTNFLREVADEAEETDLADTIKNVIIGRLTTLRDSLVEVLRLLTGGEGREAPQQTEELEVQEVAWTEVDWEKIILDYPEWRRVREHLPSSELLADIVELLEVVDNSPIFKRICRLFGLSTNLSVVEYFREEIEERIDLIARIVDEKVAEEKGRWQSVKTREGLPRLRDSGLGTLKGKALRFFRESREIIEKYLPMAVERPINMGTLAELFKDAVVKGNWDEVKVYWEKINEIGELVLEYLRERLQDESLTGVHRDKLKADVDSLAGSLEHLVGVISELGLALKPTPNRSVRKFALLRRLVS